MRFAEHLLEHQARNLNRHHLQPGILQWDRAIPNKQDLAGKARLGQSIAGSEKFPLTQVNQHRSGLTNHHQGA